LLCTLHQQNFSTMKLGALGWGGHEECMAYVRNFVLYFCSKPCRKKPNWETRHRRRDVRMYVRIHVCHSVACLCVSPVYKGKAVPLQTCSGPEGSRKLRFPDFMRKAQDGSKVVILTQRPPLPPGSTPGTHFFVRGYVDPRVITWPERFHVNEKFKCHEQGSNEQPSGL
jgi:hypothetical protein